MDDIFYGGVIYIDLRGYTRIVEKKVLGNIASLIYHYQQDITNKVYELFDDEVAAIEYMGDGVCIILKNKNKNNTFVSTLYRNTLQLKDTVYSTIESKKQELTGLNDLDFGIGISTSRIYQKSILSPGQTIHRKMFFGTSLNRAAKIGDSMNNKKNYIGIDKMMYDEFLENSLGGYYFVKAKKPIVHMYERNELNN